MIHSANMPSMTVPDAPEAYESKPCKCGRKGCLVRRRENEKRYAWVERKFRDRSCASWWNNMTNPAMREARAAGGRASSMERRSQGMSHEKGALVTHPEWLERPSGRIAAQRAAHGVVVP